MLGCSGRHKPSYSDNIYQRPHFDFIISCIKSEKRGEEKCGGGNNVLILVFEGKSFAVYHAFSSPQNGDIVQTLSLSSLLH